MLLSNPFTFIRNTVDNGEAWLERFSRKVANVRSAEKGIDSRAISSRPF
jgi:hypothetical protein